MSVSFGKAFNVSKSKGHKEGGFRDRVLLLTVFYIITKIFNFKKKVIDVMTFA